jgi:hypothetical protein
MTRHEQRILAESAQGESRVLDEHREPAVAGRIARGVYGSIAVYVSPATRPLLDEFAADARANGDELQPVALPDGRIALAWSRLTVETAAAIDEARREGLLDDEHMLNGGL